MYINVSIYRREVNVIKINSLKGELLVNEKEKIYLRGINKNLIETIGKINIPIKIDNKELNVEFNLI